MRGNQKSGCQLSSARNPWTFMAEATFIRAAFCISEASGCKLQKLKKKIYEKTHVPAIKLRHVWPNIDCRVSILCR